MVENEPYYFRVRCPHCTEMHKVWSDKPITTNSYLSFICPKTNKKVTLSVKFEDRISFTKEELQYAAEYNAYLEQKWYLEESQLSRPISRDIESST